MIVLKYAFLFCSILPIFSSSYASVEQYVLKFKNHERSRDQIPPINDSDSQIDKIVNDIQKTPNDEREYRGLVLKNGMKIMLISDPSSNISSACLNIKIGSHHDPDDFLGMAHFVEHMLFLGSEKYPGHSYFNDFITTNGGSPNAFTMSENTGYFYDIPTSHFLEALDIFAHNFISPKFNITFIQKEVAAVHSEYKQGLKNDGRRIHSVFASSTDRRHPFHRFQVGSTETLLGGDRHEHLRQKTVEFFRTRYSSDLMNLVVVDKRSLDDLQSQVTPLFSQVRRAPNAPRLAKIEGYPFATKSFLGKKISTQSLIQTSQLRIHFPIPLHYSKYQEKKAWDYIQRFFTDTSKNTFLYNLKHDKLIKPVAGFYYDSLADDYGLCVFHCELTDHGLDNVEKILKRLFAYLGQIKKRLNETWLHEEIKVKSGNYFHLVDKNSEVSLALKVAEELHFFDFENVLVQSYKVQPELNTSFLEQQIFPYLTPNNFNYQVISDNFTGSLTEKYYNVSYDIDDIPNELLQELHQLLNNNTIDQSLVYPSPNPYIPKKLRLTPKTGITHQPAPKLLLDDGPQHRLWHGRDVIFRRPYVSARFLFRCPIYTNSVKFFKIASILNNMVAELMNEKLNQITAAGYGYSVKIERSTLSLTFNGFSGKMHSIVDSFFREFFSLKFDETIFDLVRKNQVEFAENFKLSSPNRLIGSKLMEFTYATFWTIEDQLGILKEINFNDTLTFYERLFERWHVESFIYGDIGENEAIELFDNVTSHIKKNRKSGLIFNSELTHDWFVKFSADTHLLYRQTSPIQSQTGTLIAFQIDVRNAKDSLICEFLSQLISSQFFIQMRTEQSLGYTAYVTSTFADHNSKLIEFVIVGPHHPEFVESRIEKFIESIPAVLGSFNETQINSTKEAMKELIDKKPDSSRAQEYEFWHTIDMEIYDFKRHEYLSNVLSTITKEDVLELVKKSLLSGASDRRKLSIHMFANGIMLNDPEKTEFDSVTKNATLVTNILEFKKYMPLYGLRKPRMKLKKIGL